MPTLWGNRRTTVELSIASIDTATNATPETNQSSISTENVTNVSNAFARGSEHGTLAETSINDEDGYHLRLLGENSNMSFKLVRVGRDFFVRDDATGKKTRRPAVGVKAQTTENTNLYDSTFVGIPSKGKSADSLASLVSDGCAGSTASPLALKQSTPHIHPIEEQALSINIFLSLRTFSYGDLEGRHKTSRNDIKIDAYLNGQLLESRCVTYSQYRASGARALKARVVRTTGHRLGRLIEKPLVFRPSMSAKGKASLPEVQPDLACPRSLVEIWRLVSNALLGEANSYGLTKSGDAPVISEYLRSLAEHPIPSAIEGEYSTGLAVGIIDVVIIHGKGRKDDPNSKYVVEPTRIRVPNSSSAPADAKTDRLPIFQPARESRSGHRASTGTGGLDGSPENGQKNKSDPPVTDRAQYSALRPSGRAKTPPSSQSIHATLTGRENQRKRSRAPSFASPSSVKRRSRRSTTHFVTNHPPTAEEQFRAVAEHGKVSAEHVLSARSKLANADSHGRDEVSGEPCSSPLSSLPPEDEVSLLDEAKPSRIVTLSLSPKKYPMTPVDTAVENDLEFPSATLDTARDKEQTGRDNDLTISSKKPSTPTVESLVEDILDLTSATVDKPTYEEQGDPKNNNSVALDTPRGVIHINAQPTIVSTPVSGPIKPRAAKAAALAVLLPSLKPKRPMPPLPQTSSSEDETPLATTSAARSRNEALDAHFQMPPLSQDCCVTFAERGVVRNVSAVRGGHFEERGVIMGVRFIVG